MTTTQFRRQPRQPGPELPTGEIRLQEPPGLPEPASGQASNMLLYLPMIAGAGGMALLFTGSGGSRVHWLASALIGVSMLGMGIGALVRKQHLGLEFPPVG